MSRQKHTDNNLTWRELEVLQLLAERLTNKEIADRLHLAESTVKDYVGRILGKLYVKNRREAVSRAKELGLLGDDSNRRSMPVSNLPAEATPFIGRQEELAEIKRQIQSTRLLTLTGPGGIGKTRLALKTAAQMAADFPDGSYLVPLAPISAIEHIIQAICEAIRFPLAGRAEPQRQLLRYLRSRELLLVMDNYEHLLAGASIISAIMEVAPKVKIIATSRERLNLQSETILVIGGMAIRGRMDGRGGMSVIGPETGEEPVDLEPAADDAVALFVESARKVRPGFDPSPAELTQIINICRVVEGMPLAIELAAAWLQLLSVEEVAGELEKGLDILSTGVRDLPERHRSIQAVFDYSWSLLNQDEQALLLPLSVFRGGFTKEAAIQVSEASLPQLAGLVSKSFLSHDPESARLELHELLRQYLQVRLAESPGAITAAQSAHAAYYAAFMDQRERDLKGLRQLAAITEINADIENIRLAWRYYLGLGDSTQIRLFIFGLWQLHWIRGWNLAGTELFGDAAQALQGQQGQNPEIVRALTVTFQAFFMGWLGLAHRGFDLALESVAIFESYDYPEGLAFALESMLINAYILNDLSAYGQAVDRLGEIVDRLDDRWLTALTNYAACLAALVQSDYVKARRLAGTNLKLNEEIGDLYGSTMSLIALGHAAFACSEYSVARGYYLRCLALSEQLNFHYSLQTSTKYLGKVDISLGRLKEAEIYLTRSLSLTNENGFVRDIINLFYEFARLRLAQGDIRRATELLGMVAQHPASRQSRLIEGRIRDSARALLNQIEPELTPAAYSTALESGTNLGLEETIAELLKQHYAGREHAGKP